MTWRGNLNWIASRRARRRLVPDIRRVAGRPSHCSKTSQRICIETESPPQCASHRRENNYEQDLRSPQEGSGAGYEERTHGAGATARVSHYASRSWRPRGTKKSRVPLPSRTGGRISSLLLSSTRRVAAALCEAWLEAKCGISRFLRG